LIEKTELASGEAFVTVCIAFSRAEVVGKFNTGGERVETVDGRGYARYITKIMRHNDSQ
jgi:hypothetical protein